MQGILDAIDEAFAEDAEKESEEKGDDEGMNHEIPYAIETQC